MRLLILSILVMAVILPRPAAAQDPLLGDGETPWQQLMDESGRSKTPSDYANLYYDRCVAGNQRPEMDEYTKRQCACTSASLMEFMSQKDFENLFTAGEEGNFQYARMLLLGYIPCLQGTVGDYVRDECLYNSARREKLKHEILVCGCMAEGMGEYAAKYGRNLIPGFTRKSFDRTQTVTNPLESVINSGGFGMRSAYFTTRCMQQYEYPNSQGRKAQP